MTSISYGHNFFNMADNNLFFKVLAELSDTEYFKSKMDDLTPSLRQSFKKIKKMSGIFH